MGGKKYISVSLRFYKNELALFREIARINNISVSEFLRSNLNKNLEEIKSIGIDNFLVKYWGKDILKYLDYKKRMYEIRKLRRKEREIMCSIVGGKND